ncbi:hypothetical protein M569_06252, partial [Genlisea aurea]
QPYRCNQKWVVSLTPLPHNGSGSLVKGNGACRVCERKLNGSDHYLFCSIACKVEAKSGEAEKRRSQKDGTSDDRRRSGVGSRKRARKGVPRRA